MQPDTSTRDTWTEPGTFEITPGVYRIPLPLPNDGLRAVNVYALVHGGDLVLIDSGWAIAGARALLDEGLDALGCSAGDVRRILVTHVHRDHYTQAVYLRREFGTPVSLGIGDRESLASSMRRDRPPLQNQLAYLRLLGAGELADRVAKLQGPRDPYKTGWEMPDDWLPTARSRARRPPPGRGGHARAHPRPRRVPRPGGGLLFAGDHVLPAITPSIGFEPVLSDDSARRVPGLAGPDAGAAGRAVAARARAGHREHPRAGGRAHRAPRRPARRDRGGHPRRRPDRYEAAARLRWTRRGRALADLDPFNQMLAITETAAHLQVLAAQGRVTRQEADGLRYYLPA